MPARSTALLQCVAGDPILLDVAICASICERVLGGLSLVVVVVEEEEEDCWVSVVFLAFLVSVVWFVEDEEVEDVVEDVLDCLGDGGNFVGEKVAFLPLFIFLI